MAIKSGLFTETVTMAFETLRAQKMRSSLTVLGIVIGIPSIVGMTAIIRGFDESLRETIRGIGPWPKGHGSSGSVRSLKAAAQWGGVSSI